MLLFPLLKALRMDANDGFFVKPVLGAAIEDWEAWPNGALGFVVNRVVAECVESTEADESPLEWWKKLCWPNAPDGVVMLGADGESLPKPPNPNPGRPNGIGAERTSSSSKSTRNEL